MDSKDKKEEEKKMTTIRKIALYWACGMALLLVANWAFLHDDTVILLLVAAFLSLLIYLDIFRNAFPKYVYVINIIIISFILFFSIFGTIGIFYSIP